MGEPVRAVLAMVVPAEHAGTFEREWCAVAAWVARQPGCLRQTLSRAPEEDPTYVITSDWADLAAYRDFERSTQQDEATARLRALRRSASTQVLEIVEHRESA